MRAEDLRADTDSEKDTARKEKESERGFIYTSDQWYTTPRTNRSGDEESDSARDMQPRFEWRATMLLVVVLCLEATDIIFAIDSVSAIIAEIPDLYLAYTACVFAMLGLRAMFFVIDELVKLFSLLKYGVGLILCFIGVKLLLKGYVYFPPMLVSGILFATLATSMVASVVYEKYFATEEDKDED